MNIGPGSAPQKFQCCDAAKCRTHGKFSNRLTFRGSCRVSGLRARRTTNCEEKCRIIEELSYWQHIDYWFPRGGGGARTKKAPKPMTYSPSDPDHFLCAIRIQSLTI